jgi:hypothetical protein
MINRTILQDPDGPFDFFNDYRDTVFWLDMLAATGDAAADRASKRLRDRYMLDYMNAAHEIGRRLAEAKEKRFLQSLLGELKTVTVERVPVAEEQVRSVASVWSIPEIVVEDFDFTNDRPIVYGTRVSFGPRARAVYGAVCESDWPQYLPVRPSLSQRLAVAVAVLTVAWATLAISWASV